MAILSTSDEIENPWLAITLAVSAGAAFVISGLIAVVRRPENRTGALLAATGYAWFLAALSPSGNDWVFNCTTCDESAIAIADISEAGAVLDGLTTVCAVSA